MIAPSAARAIAAQWQDATDQGLETGEAARARRRRSARLPRRRGAAARNGRSQHPARRRCQTAAGRRRRHTLVADSAAAPAGCRPRPPKPDPQLAYTAPDPATHQAALTAWDRRQSPYRAQPAALPIALQTPFTPEDRPAAASGMETLLFALSAAEQAPRDGWVAWVAVVVALILLLLAAIV
jgi:hypothetical protein